MRKSLATLALLGALMFTPSCAAGPFRLSRTWDDIRNQNYTENAWIHGFLLGGLIPVYGIVWGFAYLGDVVVMNNYYFWFKDAFDDNKGTGYNHKALSGAGKSVTGFGWE
jgi:hypothetical protein